MSGSNCESYEPPDVPQTSTTKTYADDVLNKVFSNPLILNKMLQHIQPNELLTTRIVCKFWNHCILSFIEPPFILSIDKALASSINHNQDRKLYFQNDKLTRRIYVDAWDDDKEFGNNVVQFCQQFGRQVESIKFWAYANQFNNLLSVLQVGLCPQLSSLCGFVETIISTDFNLPVLSSLKVLKIEPGVYVDEIEPMKQLFKNCLTALINNSPALEEIKFFDDILVNVIDRSNLQTLKNQSISQIKDIKEMQTLLQQVSSTIQTLVFDCRIWLKRNNSNNNQEKKEQETIQFPVMRQLQQLCLKGPGTVHVGRHLENLTETILPKLRILSLDYTTNDSLEQTLIQQLQHSCTTNKGSGYFKHTNLRILILSGNYSRTDHASNIKLHFPNLTKLKII